MTNRSYNDFISVARILGVDMAAGECPEERVARVFLALAEEIQAIKEPPGRDFWTERGQLPPEERSQRGKDGTWIDPPVLERVRDTGQQAGPESLGEGVSTPELRSLFQQAEELAGAPSAENCGCCRFYREPVSAEQYGFCRWRPEYISRYSGDWCGRFLRVPAVIL